jgi:hypothetical protein
MHNFVGQRFGRLTVNRRMTGGVWECYCDCGVVSIVTTGNLRRGNTLSCGCLWREKITVHGATGTLEYKTWRAMHERCRSNHPKTRPNYKDRGIKVCAEWSDFSTFLRDMGMRPAPNSELDRIDNDKGYSKENCRWVSPRQNLNNKRCCRFIEFNGKRQTIAEWSEELCINYRTLNNRINRGWPIERALAAVKGLVS